MLKYTIFVSQKQFLHACWSGLLIEYICWIFYLVIFFIDTVSPKTLGHQNKCYYVDIERLILGTDKTGLFRQVIFMIPQVKDDANVAFYGYWWSGFVCRRSLNQIGLTVSVNIHYQKDTIQIIEYWGGLYMDLCLGSVFFWAPWFLRELL